MSLYDDFKKGAEQRKRKAFASFEKTVDQVFRDQGSDKRLRDLIPGETQQKMKEMPALDREVQDAFDEIMALTEDSDPKSAMARAIMVYRTIVRCAKDGGLAKLVIPNGGADGHILERTLKVRLRGAKKGGEET